MIISQENIYFLIEHHLESEGRRIILESTDSLAKASKLVSDDLLSSSSKKLKLANLDPLGHGTTLVGHTPESDGSREYELERSASGSMHVFHKHDLDDFDCPQAVTGNKVGNPVQNKEKDLTELPLKQACNSIGNSVKASHEWSDWKPFEKDLYLKGLEIFGRNRFVNVCFF